MDARCAFAWHPAVAGSYGCADGEGQNRTGSPRGTRRCRRRAWAQARRAGSARLRSALGCPPKSRQARSLRTPRVLRRRPLCRVAIGIVALSQSWRRFRNARTSVATPVSSRAAARMVSSRSSKSRPVAARRRCRARSPSVRSARFVWPSPRLERGALHVLELVPRRSTWCRTGGDR